MDKLLDMFHLDNEIHNNAIQHALDKGYSKEEVDLFFQPEFWDVMYELIKSGKYHTKITTEYYIDKVTGAPLSYNEASAKNFVEVRKIYVMTKEDRIVWNAIYQCLYKEYSHLIHPLCCSYKKGESTRKVIKKLTKDFKEMDKFYGTKHDLTKYFDSVPITELDKLMNELETMCPSAIWTVIKEFYHDNRILVNGEEVEKYCSLKQGCAVSAFFADLVCRDIDEFMSKQPVVYYRYSDDCIIAGKGASAAVARERMSKMLKSKGLSFNAKKTEDFNNKRWITFLGFKIKNTQVTISKKSLDNLTHKIKSETIFKCKQLHRALTENEVRRAIDNIQYWLFVGCEKSDSGMGGYLFGACNDLVDIATIDTFIKDCLRASLTNKCDIYGLSASYGEHGIVKGGFDKNGVYRPGKNVAMNMAKTEDTLEKLGWYSLMHMYKKYHQGIDVYKAEVNKMRNGECYEGNKE